MLSFYYLWHIRNSQSRWRLIWSYVVNCFHFTIFDISETVNLAGSASSKCCELLSFYYLWHIRNSLVSGVACVSSLWIAFILLSLTYQKQFVDSQEHREHGCELLSFYYLWHIRNSVVFCSTCSVDVVNCFHFTIFDISETVAPY